MMKNDARDCPFTVVKTVGMVVSRNGHGHPDIGSAVAEGREWLEGERASVERQCIDEGTDEAATYPTSFQVEDAEGVIVYRSGGTLGNDEQPTYHP